MGPSIPLRLIPSTALQVLLDIFYQLLQTLPARLWSMETMSNVVAFRGHENPIWDVKWSPIGVYFATASRDRTARLWSTDRTSCLRIYAGHLSDVDVRVTLD